MNFRTFTAWAVLLVLGACLAVSPTAGMGTSAIEDRNFDGQADVWQFYDEDGELVRVLRDRNFDGYVDTRETISTNRVISRAVDQNFDRQFEPSFTGRVTIPSDVTSSVAVQPFLLPRAVYVGDRPLAYRASVALASSSESRTPAIPSGRAPPAAL
jgi:hypothetical protein